MRGRKTGFLLNGSAPSKKELSAFIHALSDTGTLAARGGYLFKSRLADGKLHIGIVPAIADGERLHHYDIQVPDGEHLLGSVSATGELTILFKAAALNEESKKVWREQYEALAGFLIDSGYSGEGRLDWISRKIIEESGIFQPIPETLIEIASPGQDSIS